MLVLGAGYKRNHEDARESPGLRLLEAGAPGVIRPARPRNPAPAGASRPFGAPEHRWSAEALRGFDAALIAADHDGVDYAALADAVPLVVDTRNVCARLGLAGPHIVKA